MSRNSKTDLTRRFVLAASGGLLLPRWSWAEEIPVLAQHWKLDGDGDLAIESVSSARDAIASRTGHAIWVGEGRDRALRLDGYSVWLRHNAAHGIAHGASLTVMAWIALEAYPVNEAALLQMDSKGSPVFRLSIDRLGFLQGGRHPGDLIATCRASEALPKAKWVHVVASMGSSGITLYRDGIVCGHLPGSLGRLKAVEDLTFVIGGAPDCPMVANIFPTGVLNGLLRDVRVYDRQLDTDSLSEIIAASRPEATPDLQLNRAWCADDPQRPICHAQPPRAWTNEPHGLLHWRGQYHLFYQKNANGPYWGHLNWGHMTSPDLLRWTEMPVAISPEPGFDSEGCWSGSVIEHKGRLAILYTGVDGVKAGIAVAFSDDGVHFTKHPDNPVIPRPPNTKDFLDFRDPFLWRQDNGYYLLVGAGVKDVGGTALLYWSEDLLHWKYRKQIYSGTIKSSGLFWEMPIFLQDGDSHALIVNELPAIASYWVGSWKGEIFSPINSEPKRLELFNHLLSPTPLIEADGQIVVVGIVPEERSPKETSAAGWANLYSLPRSISIDAGGVIVQRPHASLEALCHSLTSISSVELEAGSIYELQNLTETSLRLRVTIQRGSSTSVSVLLRRSPKGEEQTVIHYEWDKKQLTLDRTKSSLDAKVNRDRQTTTYLPAERNSLRLDLFVDRSILEVFVDDRAAFSARIYPSLKTSAGVAFTSEGVGAKLEDVRIARLERPA